jgi:hypothetical protein
LLFNFTSMILGWSNLCTLLSRGQFQLCNPAPGVTQGQTLNDIIDPGDWTRRSRDTCPDVEGMLSWWLYFPGQQPDGYMESSSVTTQSHQPQRRCLDVLGPWMGQGVSLLGPGDLQFLGKWTIQLGWEMGFYSTGVKPLNTLSQMAKRFLKFT